MSLHDDIKIVRKQLTKDIARKEFLEARLSTFQTDQGKLQALQEAVLKAKALIQEAAQMTQQKIEFHVSNLVTMALAAVWDDPYEFRLEFVKRRGTTEADLWFVRNSSKAEPMESSGGGAKDIASFALRVGYWSLTKASRPIMIIDEPFRNLSEALQPRAAEMLRTLSDRLGLQIICASHITMLKQQADRTFEVQLIENTSKIFFNKSEELS